MFRVAASVAALAAAVSRAQEVAVPEASPSPAADLSPAPPPATTEPTVPPPQLIPPDILPMPDPSAPPVADPSVPTIEQLDEVLKPKAVSKASEDQRLFIEWRKLRNKATNDPEMKAAFAASQHARTDLEKRHLLARYFDLLFDKEIAMAPPEMKNYLNDRRREHLSPLPQPRVRPTTPTPSPKPKRGDKTPKDSTSPASSPPPAPPLPAFIPSASPTPSPPLP